MEKSPLLRAADKEQEAIQSAHKKPLNDKMGRKCDTSYTWYVPLNLERIFANSLFIRFISASLLLQFRMSDINTARPRIESPFGAGILIELFQLTR